MPRIKIAHVLYSFGTGGLEKGITTLARHGSPQIEHVIVCLSQAGNSMRMLPENTPVVELNKQSGNSFRFLLKLKKALQKIQPDIVHTRNWGGMDGILAARMGGVKRIIQGEHGWGVEDPDGTNPKRRAVRRWMSTITLEQTCVSKQIQSWLKDEVRIKKPVTQVYNGVDTNFYCPGKKIGLLREKLGLDDSTLIVGTVGRLDPIKNHRALFEAFVQVRSGIPHACLIVVGDGPEFVRLQSIGGEGIHFLGERNDAHELYREMDLFVLPSMNEGISNTLLEAMASGVPVVASNVGGNPELIRQNDNGFLFDPDSPREMAQSLLLLLQDKKMRQECGYAGRKRAVQDFSIQSMVAGYEDVYRRVAAQHI